MKRLYVLIREDLTVNYGAVQAGHVVGKFVAENAIWWHNEYLIYLGVKNLDQLELWEHKIKKKDFNYAAFNEPDLNNQMTAIACLPDNSEFFDKLQKWPAER